jgi:hypothetical protein
VLLFGEGSTRIQIEPGMSIRYLIDPEARLVTVSVEGDLGIDEYLEANGRLSKDPDFCPDYAELIDLRKARLSEISGQNVREFAERPPLYSADSRMAVVAPGDLEFGLARMFEALRDGARTVRVFRELADAHSWIASG